MKTRQTGSSRTVSIITKLDVQKIKAETAINRDRLFVSQWQSLISGIDTAARNGYSQYTYVIVDLPTADRIKSELRTLPGIVVDHTANTDTFVVRW